MIGQFMLHKNHYLKRFSKFSSFGMKLLWDGINKISNDEFAGIIQKVIHYSRLQRYNLALIQLGGHLLKIY